MLKLRLNTNLTKLNIAELEGQITNGFEKNKGEILIVSTQEVS